MDGVAFAFDCYIASDLLLQKDMNSCIFVEQRKGTPGR